MRIPVKLVVGALVAAALSAQADLYVSENGADTNPGTEAAPFRTIQAAVDAAPQEGCTIHVGVGTFIAKANVAAPNPVLLIEKPVTILGSGADKTFVSAANAARYVVRMNCAGALLKDVCICNSLYNAWVTGVGLTLVAGEVRNVVIENITGYNTPGADVSGGALYDSVIRKISSNTTPNGIGVLLKGTGLVSGCEIYGLSKVGNGSMTGAGVRQEGGTLENCYIHDNWLGNITYASHQSSSFADCSGAGLWMSGGIATGCRILRNSCIGHAAGVKVTGSAVLENSVVVDNVASNIFVNSQGGGVSVDGAKAVVRGCVIANNRALRGAEGLALLNGTVTNNVIYANGISNVFVKAGTFADNALVNPGIAETEAYALPAADAFSCSFEADRTFIRDNVGGEVTFTATAKNAPGEVSYSWSFSDGGVASGAEATHAFGVGRHTVTLTATAGGETAVCRTKEAIVVYPQKVYVSKSGRSVFPYTTEEDAAEEIDDVTDLYPLEIVVHGGTYGLRNKGLFFCYPVRLTGDGPKDTIVDGKGKSYTRGLVLDHPDAFVSGVQFYNNTLTTWDSGAGIQLFNGTVSNCWVRNAYAYNNIGVNLWGGKLVDSLVTECQNGSSQMGLGVSLRGGSMYGCVVSNNTTTGAMNGIVYINSANSVVSNCVICCNQAGNTTASSSKGGGISMSAGLVTNSKILDNTSATLGAVYLTGGTLRNCLVAGNETILAAGSNGGGVYNDGGTVENCTIVDNSATGAGDGLYQKKGTTVNAIVVANAADNLVVEAGSVTYTTSSPVVDGEGNTATAPAFVSLANGDYHLTSLSSDQIDRGTLLPWMTADATDLDGNVRVTNDIPDMGCYEYAPSDDEPFIVQFRATGVSGRSPVNASFEAVISKYPVDECDFFWYFGDSAEPVVISGEAVTTHRYETAGSYTVRLVVKHGTDAGAPTQEFAVESCVTVIPEVCYVSTTGSNVAPYASPATAAASLSDALTVGSDKIVIDDGTYTEPAMALTRQVEIASANGPAATTLKPKATGVPFITMSDDGAKLLGVTVTGGETTGHEKPMGGSDVHMTAGVVSNCVIRKGSQYGYGMVYAAGTSKILDSVIEEGNSWANAGEAGGIYMEGSAFVAGCVIRNNEAANINNDALGGSGAVVNGGTMSNCVFYGNTTTNGKVFKDNTKSTLTLVKGLVTHCVVTNNEANSFAGGVWQKGGTLRNCLIANNKAMKGSRTQDGAAGLLLENGVAESLTIVGNQSSTTAGGVRQNGGVLLNSIIFGNTQSSLECELLGGVQSNCLSTTAIDAPGCLAGDPLFENAGAGDYRLTVLSPAKEKGLWQAWMDGAADLAGFTRVSGDAVDIGAYEADASIRVPFAVTVDQTSSVKLPNGNTRIAFLANVVGNEGEVTLTWDFGDGAEAQVTTESAVEHEFAPGAYTVKVRGRDAATEETTAWFERAAAAIPKVCYVAKGEGVTPVYPYVTPETAAPSPNEAIAAGSEEVCILPGTYALAESLKLTRDVKVYSQSGNPDDVVLTRTTDGVALAASVNSENAVLRGVTVHGGSLRDMSLDNGATLKLLAGTVEDCILESGVVYSYGAVSVNGGVLRRSVIRNCKDVSTAVSFALQLNGGLVDSCVITNNVHEGNDAGDPGAVCVSGSKARLHNSLIAFNRSRYNGAGLRLSNSAAGEIVNCTIVSNTAARGFAGVITDSNSVQPVVCCNNIVAGNVSPETANLKDSIASWFSYSCGPDLVRGVGNIAADPLFETRRSRPLFSLSRRSPCIDRGSWLALGETKDAVRAQTDLRGAARLSGPEVDIGCYECPLKGFTLLVR